MCRALFLNYQLLMLILAMQPLGQLRTECFSNKATRMVTETILEDWWDRKRSQTPFGRPV